MQRALFIMAKAPVPGEVKTRLCPPLTPAMAAKFYRCFLLDIFATAQRLKEVEELSPLDLFVAYHPAGAEKTFRAITPKGFQLFPQEGEGLSARLINSFGRLFARGYSTVAVLSSDSPTLPPQELATGLLRLEKNQEKFSLTIMPCRDGGYCFLAMKQFHPEIFEDIDWSTEKVFSQTTHRADQLGISWFSLPPWYDLDTAEDFKYLKELLKNKAAAERPGPAGRHTLEFFKAHLQGYVKD